MTLPDPYSAVPLGNSLDFSLVQVTIQSVACVSPSDSVHQTLHSLIHCSIHSLIQKYYLRTSSRGIEPGSGGDGESTALLSQSEPSLEVGRVEKDAWTHGHTATQPGAPLCWISCLLAHLFPTLFSIVPWVFIVCCGQNFIYSHLLIRKPITFFFLFLFFCHHILLNCSQSGWWIGKKTGVGFWRVVLKIIGPVTGVESGKLMVLKMK